MEEHNKSYVLCVSGKEYVPKGAWKVSAGSILKELPEEGWLEASCGDGSKGARVYDWMLSEAGTSNPGWTRHILVRRRKTKPEELRAYICCGPEGTGVQKLAEIAGVRWTAEVCFAESKSEAGLDQ